MKIQNLHEVKYAGPKSFENLLQHFRTMPSPDDRARYVPRDDITVKNVVDEFDYDGQSIVGGNEVKMLIVFENRVRVFYRDDDHTFSREEAAEKLAVFALKRIF